MNLRNWFRRKELERGLDRELLYHYDRLVSDLMQSGLTEQDARRKANLELGGVAQVQEEVRDIWLTRWLRDFLYDLRFSVRSFRRSPSFTVTAALSLALGIGATTAIYSLVDQVVLHALSVREPEKLVLVDWKGDQVATGFGSWNLMSYPICRDLQLQDRFFEGVFCRAANTVNFSAGGDVKPTAVEIVSGSYFTVLGVQPLLGRLIGPDEDGAPGSNPVVVLAYDFWKTQFGADAAIVGRKVLVNQFPLTVIGVADPQFRGIDVGEVPAFWIPASMSGVAIPDFKRQLDRRTRWMQILGRLRPEMTVVQAQAGLQPWFKGMLADDLRRSDFPRITAERRQHFLSSTLVLTPAPQGHSSLRRRWTQPLWVLFSATAVLLGLACLNVAGLFLARGSAREREISTRLALGASRGRLARQLLADSVLLALAGGSLGVATAPLALRTLIAFLPKATADHALRATIDTKLLFFAFAVSMMAGFASGLAPALQAGRRSLIASLRERGGSGLAGIRLRKGIMTAQIAFTLILVTGAALFFRTLTGLLEKGPGFTTTSLVSFGLDPVRNGYSRAAASQLIRRVHSQIVVAPGIASSAVARFPILTGGSWMDPMTIQARERMTTDRDVNLNAVSPAFFSTLGIKLVIGRDFDQRDALPAGEGGPRAAIVNEAFAKRYLRGASPLGVRICEGAGPDAKPNVEVIGVVSDFSYRGIREDSEQAFFPAFEGNDAGATFYSKVRGTPEEVLPAIREIVRKADPAVPIMNFRTLDEQVNRSLNAERMLATVLGGFGTLALLLSLVGLYGVMSFVVTQRTREIGIRLAMGATGSSALWLVLRDTLWMVAAGTCIAVPASVALGRLVESQLFGVKPADPRILAVAILVLTTAAIGAALIPAYRAATVNPVEALRAD